MKDGDKWSSMEIGSFAWTPEGAIQKAYNIVKYNL
jgi:hypothetical protein